MGGEVNQRRPLKEDKIYAIPTESVLDVQIIQDGDGADAIAIRTVNAQQLIYGHFKGEIEQIVLAVKMVINGKLAQALGLQIEPQNQSITAASEGDSVEKLTQLKKMLDSGLITLQEYESKKSDILSRM